MAHRALLTAAVLTALAAPASAQWHTGPGPDAPKEPLPIEGPAFLDPIDKLEPVLRAQIENPADEQPIEVDVWLHQSYDPDENSTFRREAEELDDQGLAKLLEDEAIKLIAQTNAPFVQWVIAQGGAVVYQSIYAPVVSVRLTPAQLLDAALRDDVDKVYLSRTYLPETEHAAKTVRADLVWSRGVTGSGLTGNRVGVVESGRIHFTNPYMAHIANTMVFNAGIGAISQHKTGVAGVIAAATNDSANHHGRWRGVAYGLNNMLDANPATSSTAGYIAAVDWAVMNGGRILNSSYGFDTNLQIVALDRYYDYVVRHNFVMMVKSAGNNGPGFGTATGNVTSPGMGWNTLAVGSFQSAQTNTWTDDVMSTFSSTLPDPGSPGWRDRQKPEMVAVGEDQPLRIDRLDITPGPWMTSLGAGTSFAAPQVVGVCALMAQRRPALLTWPEEQRAILLASACHDVAAGSMNADGVGGLVACEADEVVTQNRSLHEIVNAADFGGPGPSRSHTIQLNADLPARVVLCWDSNPTRQRILGASTALTNTVLTDGAANFGPNNSKVGWFIQPSTRGRTPVGGVRPLVRSFRVTANTATTLTVAGGSNMRSFALVGHEYALFPNPASDLAADLDLEIRSNTGALLASSRSYDNSFEFVTFTPPYTGNYEVRIIRFRFNGASEYLSVAWTQEPCCRPDFGDAPDDMLHCLTRPERGDFPTRLISNGARVTEFENEWFSFDNTTWPPGATWETDAYVTPFAAEKDEDMTSNILILSCLPDRDGEDDGVRPDPVYLAGTCGRVAFQIDSATPNIDRYSTSRADEKIYAYFWFDWEHDDTTWAGNLMAAWEGGPTMVGRMTAGKNCISGCDRWNPANSSKLVVIEFQVPDFLLDGPFWIRGRMDYGERIGTTTGQATYGEVEDHISYQFRWTPWECIIVPTTATPGVPIVTDACFSAGTWTENAVPVFSTFPEGICPPEDIATYYIIPPEAPPVETPPNDWHWSAEYTVVPDGRQFHLSVDVVNFPANEPLVVPLLVPTLTSGIDGPLQLSVDVGNNTYAISDPELGTVWMNFWNSFPFNLPPFIQASEAVRRNSSIDPRRPQWGACCITLEDGQVYCDDTLTNGQCLTMGGVFQGQGVRCADVFACGEQVLGACCFDVGVCADNVVESECLGADGVFLGAGSTCNETSCIPFIGACCLPGGDCVGPIDQVQCVSTGGVYLGDGSTCDNAPCAPAVTGACIYPEGICVDGVTPFNCLSVGGDYLGDGTSCGNPAAGACCLPDASCIILTADECSSLSGEYRGDGSGCLNCAVVECPPNGTPENEPCDPGNPSGTNGGCNTDPANPPLEPLICGVPICGTAFVAGVRDTDWYVVNQDIPAHVTVTLLPQFNAVLLELDVTNCPPQVLQGVFAPAGVATTLSHAFSTSTTYWFVAPDFSMPLSCAGGNGYVVTADCQPLSNAIGACCIPNNCFPTTAFECLLIGGQFQGDGTTCDSAPCAFEGACCLAAGCVQTTGQQCELFGGAYLGDGTSCARDDCGAAPCPGDYNMDGVRNTADFFEFFADFFASPPDADYNMDGVTNTADFFEFFSDFFGPPCE